MAQQQVTDEVAVRCAIGTGLLFVVTGVEVASGVRGEHGVVLLLTLAVVLSAALDRPHALLLGVAGWAFATGFAINTLGDLTLGGTDLVRLAVFVVAVALPHLARGMR